MPEQTPEETVQARVDSFDSGDLDAVRVWKEDVAGGSEFRGSLREVVSGASHSFRDWPDLIVFMVEQVREVDNAQAGRMKGGTS